MGRLTPAPAPAPTAALCLLLAAACGGPSPPGEPAEPRVRGGATEHVVRPGETLWRIARRYGVDLDELIRINGIGDVHRVPAGVRLLIPDGDGSHGASFGPATRREAARLRARADALRAARLAFGWPLRGRLTAPFGPRHGRPHEGIDVAAPRGTPVRAAEAGRVIHAGPLGAYGKLVVVDHGGGFSTVYAHNRRILVRKGERVEKGQALAEVGATGNATGPHLHFEVRVAKVARDPLLYLP